MSTQTNSSLDRDVYWNCLTQYAQYRRSSLYVFRQFLNIGGTRAALYFETHADIVISGPDLVGKPQKSVQIDVAFDVKGQMFQLYALYRGVVSEAGAETGSERRQHPFYRVGVFVGS
jgi:hypothetical protein